MWGDYSNCIHNNSSFWPEQIVLFCVSDSQASTNLHLCRTLGYIIYINEHSTEENKSLQLHSLHYHGFLKGKFHRVLEIWLEFKF